MRNNTILVGGVFCESLIHGPEELPPAWALHVSVCVRSCVCGDASPGRPEVRERQQGWRWPLLERRGAAGARLSASTRTSLLGPRRRGTSHCTVKK